MGKRSQRRGSSPPPSRNRPVRPLAWRSTDFPGRSPTPRRPTSFFIPDGRNDRRPTERPAPHGGAAPRDTPPPPNRPPPRGGPAPRPPPRRDQEASRAVDPGEGLRVERLLRHLRRDR